MKINQQFTVARDMNTVWAFFQDIPSVADCLPGATLTSVNEDGSYSGQMSVKLGPLSSNFEGKATVTPDDATKTGRIEGSASDKKSRSRGQIKVTYTMAEVDSGTQILIDADLALGGPAAQFGRSGLIDEMSNRLIGEFVSCVEGKLTATTADEAASIKAGEVQGFGLFFSSLVSWLRGMFRR